jgi:hypothetical protein
MVVGGGRWWLMVEGWCGRWISCRIVHTVFTDGGLVGWLVGGTLLVDCCFLLLLFLIGWLAG